MSKENRFSKGLIRKGVALGIGAASLAGCGPKEGVNNEVQPTIDPESVRATLESIETSLQEGVLTGETDAKVLVDMVEDLDDQYGLSEEEKANAHVMKIQFREEDFNLMAIPLITDMEGNTISNEQLFIVTETKDQDDGSTEYTWEELFKTIKEPEGVVEWVYFTGEKTELGDVCDDVRTYGEEKGGGMTLGGVLNEACDVVGADSDGVDLGLKIEVVLRYPATIGEWERQEREEESGVEILFAPITTMVDALPEINYSRDDGFIDVRTTGASVEESKKALFEYVPVEALDISDGLKELITNNEDFAIHDGILFWKGVSLEQVDGKIEANRFQETETGDLIAINLAKTAELQMTEGEHWVDYFIHEGEMLVVPEAVAGLPETYEETNIVGREVLDNPVLRRYFMTNLIAMEERYAREIGGFNNECITGMITNTPWSRTDYRGMDSRGSDLGLASWTRIDMGEGRMFDLVGMSIKLDGSFGDRAGERVTMHLLYDPDSTWKEVAMYGESEESVELSERAKSFYVSGMIFERLTTLGSDYFMTPTPLVSREDGVVLEGKSDEDSWSELIEFLQELDEEYDYSNAMRNAVWRSSNKAPWATDKLMEALRYEMLPVYYF